MNEKERIDQLEKPKREAYIIAAFIITGGQDNVQHVAGNR